MTQDTIPSQRRRHIKAIVDTQIIGLSRFFVGLPLEHIFDRLKTSSQAQLSSQSVTNLIKTLYLKNGIRQGLFAGFSTNFVILVLKQYYRWPLIIFMPKQIKEYSPKWFTTKFPTVHKTLTGIFMGLFETCVICPLERIKTIQMTRSQNQSIISEIRNLRGQGSLSIYTGFKVMLTKSIVSWVSYLYWDHRVRHYFKQDFDKALTPIQIMYCAAITGVLNIATVQPLDTLKTLQQMKQNDQYKEKKIFQAFKLIYKQGGIKGIYSGWQIRLSQFFIQSVLTTPVMDYLERTHGKSQIQ